MKSVLYTLMLLSCLSKVMAQDSNATTLNSRNSEQEIISLSKAKWRWMAERRVDSLNALFHEKAVFVHMGATFSKSQELEVIRSGNIQYKQAEIQETSVQF